MRHRSDPTPEPDDRDAVLQQDQLRDAGRALGENGEDEDSGDVAPAPGSSAWSEAENRASSLIRCATGRTLNDHVKGALTVRPGAQMLALGAGAGGIAVEMLAEAPEASLACVDTEPQWLNPARRRARELAVNAQFATLDLDAIELEARAFDAAFCHAVLYRVCELERIADQIRRALRPGGCLIVVDIVTRNGYQMWPETREVVEPIWRTLPAKFRLNHTAHAVPLIDDEIWEPAPASSGARTGRPENILSVLEQRFESEHFVPYFTLSRRFFDSMYGPNYDLAAPLDRAIFNWIWQLDLYYRATERLRPETFFGVYRSR